MVNLTGNPVDLIFPNFVDFQFSEISSPAYIFPEIKSSVTYLQQGVLSITLKYQ